jgi:hypothetical protein
MADGEKKRKGGRPRKPQPTAATMVDSLLESLDEPQAAATEAAPLTLGPAVNRHDFSDITTRLQAVCRSKPPRTLAGSLADALLNKADEIEAQERETVK